MLMHHHAELREGKWELNLPFQGEAESCVKKYFLLPAAGGQPPVKRVQWRHAVCQNGLSSTDTPEGDKNKI